MSGQKHIIGKQVIELQVPSGGDTFALQQEVSFVFRNEVLPRLEAMFDRMVDADTVIRLDLLEVDLGRLDPQRLAASLMEQILPKVEQALREQINSLSATASAKNQGTFKIPHSLTESLLYFLENGFFPWWGNKESWGEWEIALADTIAKNPDSAQKVLNLLRKNPRARDRFLWQFGAKMQATLTAYTGNLPDVIEGREAEWLEFFSQLGKANHWDKHDIPFVFHQSVQVLRYSLETSQIPESRAVHLLVRIFSGQLKIPYRELLKQMLEFLLEGKPVSVFGESVLQPVLLQLWEQTGKKPLSGKIQTKDSPTPESETPANKKRIQPEKEDFADENEFDKDAENQPEKPLEPGTGIFIENAGLVLLHPFLANYFTALNLIQNGHFVNEESRHRAIHLIQYLASGKTETPEHDLSLNKLLCGLPLSIPVTRGVEITEPESVESETLLQAVIGHWKALKNTSPDGLRYNFLMREGKLTFTENGWSLAVEQKTQDILLGKLPWGISRIKLSWMPDLLRVDWA
ncbi:MAG: contractile injection system tape measure protein [Bacteroidia bacterium]